MIWFYIIVLILSGYSMYLICLGRRSFSEQGTLTPYRGCSLLRRICLRLSKSPSQSVPNASVGTSGSFLWYFLLPVGLYPIFLNTWAALILHPFSALRHSEVEISDRHTISEAKAKCKSKQ